MAIRLKVAVSQESIPEGEYRVRLTEIKEGKFAGKRKTFEFLFQIVEGEHKDKFVRGFVNAHYESFSSFSKMHRWYCAATGDIPEVGEEMNLDNLYDKVLSVKVVTKASRKTNNQFSNVEEILGKVLDL